MAIFSVFWVKNRAVDQVCKSWANATEKTAALQHGYVYK